MKLKEYVENNPDKTLFVGAKVAYFFIGKAEQFNTDIDDITDKYIKSFKSSLSTARVRVTNLIKSGEPTGDIYEEYINSYGQLKTRFVPRDKAVASYYSQIDKLNKYIEQMTEYIAKFVPLKEREIKEEYIKNCMRDGTVVLIDGLEEGRFWFIDEYATGYVEVPVGNNGKKKVKVR